LTTNKEDRYKNAYTTKI